MIFSCLWLHNNVIHIVFNFFVHHIMKDHGYNPLICGSDIFETEGHNDVVKVVNRSLKGYLDCIFGWHSDLIITAETIHEWKHSMSSSWANEHIHIWKWKLIFGAYFIKISKVNTTSYLSVLFLDQYNVGKPFWVHDGLNEPSCEEFLNFLNNLSFNIRMEGPHGLYYWLCPWFHVKSMCY